MIIQGVKVVELVARKVTVQQAVDYARQDLTAYRKHTWCEKWTRRALKVWKWNMGEYDAFGTVDFAAGLSIQYASVHNLYVSEK